ncbi:MAG TPA: YaaR family protein [Bacillales bacterium]|nr:YaaR family protein [Bacillales bacterium]
MKISQEGRLSREREPQRVRPPGLEGAAFSELFRAGQAKLHTKALEGLFEEIERQAERLWLGRTFSEFLRFKQLVQQFVKEAVGSGLELRHARQWHGSGGAKTLTLVKKVDSKLTEMAELLINKQERTVDLLSTIGEIKGLLINLYR